MLGLYSRGTIRENCWMLKRRNSRSCGQMHGVGWQRCLSSVRGRRIWWMQASESAHTA